MPRAQTITSHGVVLYLNGKAFGRVRTFNFRSSTPRSAKYGLDSLDPFELVTGPTRVSGAISIYRTVGDGGAEGAGMTAIYSELPREKYFSLQLIERVSDTTIFEAAYCSIINQSWSSGEKGLMMGELEFEALDWSNELKAFKP